MSQARSLQRASYEVCGWYAIAGGIAHRQDWVLWGQNKLQIEPVLPKPPLTTIASRIRRRLDGLGWCVMSACEQCVPLFTTEPAIISVSRHGDLPAMARLMECARRHADISPTAFAYSVHNRFSSLISMVAGYRGVNAAYSSVRDGFPLALAEATTLLSAGEAQQVLVLAYEAEIPETYGPIIAAPWLPHVAMFVLQKSEEIPESPRYSLLQHASAKTDVEPSECGSCLPFLRTILTHTNHRDGFWEYQYDA